MRVVAGKYRGRKLTSPSDNSVRPTTDRIKETLFNVVQFDVPDARVLDLFAGSGALGIECISRGAAEVVFVDRSRDSISLINQNLRGIEGSFKVVASDFLGALRNAFVGGKKFDLIFIDPPYASDLGEIAINTIIELDLLSEYGKMIYEHGADKKFELSDGRYKVRTKVMGTVSAEFISKKSIAMMTGSFDPITKGHEGVLDEALRRYDEVILACLVNPDKQYAFTNEERLALASELCKYKKGARAIFSEEYAVEVAKREGATVLVRGIRSDDDRAYEEEMAAYNKEHGFDTVFIEIDSFRDVSSTKVREQISEGDYSNIPSCLVEMIRQMIK